MLPNINAGFLAVLVGYSSSAAIVLQAAVTLGADGSITSSWLLSLGMGLSATCIGLSLAYKTPILTAWSTPGAALMVASLGGYSIADGVGIFMMASFLMMLMGITNSFDRITRIIPKSLASAMLAGVLFKFGTGIFTSMLIDPVLLIIMLIVFFVFKRLNSKFSIIISFLTALAYLKFYENLNFNDVVWSMSSLEFTEPKFSVASFFGGAVPLFLVTLASQNIPGVAILRSNGFNAPASPILSWTGFIGLLLAPFGCFSINLAAITAAICMTKDAEPDPKRQYRSVVWAGVFYMIAGLFGATVASLFSVLPSTLIAGISGIALLGTISNSLCQALSTEEDRDASIIVFLVASSGFSLVGISSSFWALALGILIRCAMLSKK